MGATEAKDGPECYVVRVGEASWSILPFTVDAVCGLGKRKGGLIKLSRDEVLRELERMSMVSVVVDPDPMVWCVSWSEPWEVTGEYLESMLELEVE